MPRWWDRLVGRESFASQPVEPAPAPLLAGLSSTRTQRSITAAAINVTEQKRQDPSTRTIQSLPWQMEAWGFYDDLGEFRFGVTWKAEMTSRIRLRAARLTPDSDEPEIQDSGLAVDFVSELAGGIGGQSELISTLSVFLSVPGEGYLIGEKEKPGGKNTWQARSIDEVQYASGIWKVLSSDGSQKWRELPSDHLVIRVYRPHKRYRALADSPARAASKAMRELELVNRHIQAGYLSRLASAGVLLLPEEITFPVREEFEDAPDPFIREWVEIAAEAIRTPGTAAAVVPIPMRIPGEMIDKVKHVDFTLKLDEKIIEKRESVIKRMATQLDLPAEILLGMGDLNHWTSWQIEESAVKTHITPDMEVIAYALTDGYLRPALRAAGEPDADEWVVWYDASEITLRPDRSEAARDAYDRLEASGEAYRREIGLDENDRPNDQELEAMVLKRLAREPTTGFQALEKLTGEELPEGLQVPDEADATPPEGDEPAADGPPATRDAPPPAPDQEATANRSRLRQSGLMHTVKFNVDGSWELLHPADCQTYLFSCPVTYATRNGFTARPGKSGLYECYINNVGKPVIGRRTMNLDTHEMIKSNGHGAHHRS